MNSEAIGEFDIYNKTGYRHCEIEFGAVSPHDLSVADGFVDEVGVDEHEGRVQEAMMWLKWAEW